MKEEMGQGTYLSCERNRFMMLEKKKKNKNVSLAVTQQECGGCSSFICHVTEIGDLKEY